MDCSLSFDTGFSQGAAAPHNTMQMPTHPPGRELAGPQSESPGTYPRLPNVAVNTRVPQDYARYSQIAQGHLAMPNVYQPFYGRTRYGEGARTQGHTINEIAPDTAADGSTRSHALNLALRDQALIYAARDKNQGTTFVSSLPAGNTNKRHHSVSDNVSYTTTKSMGTGFPSAPHSSNSDIMANNPVEIGLITELAVELKLDNEHKRHLYCFLKCFNHAGPSVLRTPEVYNFAMNLSNQ
ncbi:hypothetical protein GGF50DRAFT_116937 [Schizophyllum commune]